MDQGAPGRTGRGPSWAVPAACLAAFVLRAAFGALAARHVGGDQWWYVEAARQIREGGWLVPYPAVDIRPPGLPYLLAGLDTLTGGGGVAAVRLLFAASWGLGCAAAAALARRLAPGSRHAPWVAAALLAVDPVTIEMSSRVLSENLATPLVLWGVVAALDLFERPALGRAAAVGSIWCVARFLRPDVVVEASALAAAAGLALVRRRPDRGRAVAALAVSGLVAVGGTLAWRSGFLAVAGTPDAHFQELADYPRTHAGIHCWLRTVDLPRTDHLDAIYNGPGRFDPATLPATSFDDAEEAETVRRAFAADRSDDAALEAADAALCGVGCRRAERHPVRTFVTLPFRRAYHLWLDPADSDTPRSLLRGAPEPTARGAVFRRAQTAFRWAAALAALAAIASWGLVGPRAGTVAASVVWRTAVCVAVSPLLLRSVVYEARALVTSHALALVLIPVVTAALARGRRAASG